MKKQKQKKLGYLFTDKKLRLLYPFYIWNYSSAMNNSRELSFYFFRKLSKNFTNLNLKMFEESMRMVDFEFICSYFNIWRYIIEVHKMVFRVTKKLNRIGNPRFDRPIQLNCTDRWCHLFHQWGDQAKLDFS